MHIWGVGGVGGWGGWVGGEGGNGVVWVREGRMRGGW